jgi:hypothetical protein
MYFDQMFQAFYLPSLWDTRQAFAVKYTRKTIAKRPILLRIQPESHRLLEASLSSVCTFICCLHLQESYQRYRLNTWTGQHYVHLSSLLQFWFCTTWRAWNPFKLSTNKIKLQTLSRAPCIRVSRKEGETRCHRAPCICRIVITECMHSNMKQCRCPLDEMDWKIPCDDRCWEPPIVKSITAWNVRKMLFDHTLQIPEPCKPICSSLHFSLQLNGSSVTIVEM